MRNRSTWVAWGLLTLGLVGNGIGLALSAANGGLSWHADEALLWVVFPAFLVVGCLILARRPGNVIGWIFTAVGLLTTAADLAEPYAIYAYAHPGSLPVPLVAAWVNTWIWSPTIMLMVVFPLLLFPTGRSLSPRWRLVTWLAVGLVVAYTVSGALKSSLQLPNGRAIANPIGVAGMDLDHGRLGAVLNGLLLLVFAAGIGSLVVRFRRSRGVERQQLKWFTYAGALVLLAPLSNTLVGNVSYVLVLALPAAVGVAVLRYRLYDIDRLINRTLVYGLLTALLAGVYGGAVLVLGQLFGGVGGHPRAGWWPGPPWRWLPCSSRLAAASRRSLIGASTAASTMPPRGSRRSPLVCGTRSTWTRSQPSC
ncbi:MAG TPA: hypothetical protein VFJ69_00085 [Actinomycetota bacterium]|nr:hypothetical protein [Actinomycetota bacterium]